LALAFGASFAAPDAIAAQNKPLTADVRRTVAAPAAADPDVRERPAHPAFAWPAAGRMVMGFCEDPMVVHLVVPPDSVVRAAAGGRVAYVGSDLKGFRNLILILHQDGWVSAYADSDVTMLKRGDIVQRGQVIARFDGGGPLHFELRHGSVSVDPRLYMEGVKTDVAQAMKHESCG
jgi:murein DD-endopeptidase MepM/ murein hydrolase activator NlpD